MLRSSLNASIKSSQLTTCMWNGVLLSSKSAPKCLQMWSKMNPNCKDTTSWNAAISAHLSLSNFKEAYQLLDEMTATEATEGSSENTNAFKCSPNQETFCILLDQFIRYKSMRRISRTLLNLAISKYQLESCESFAFYACMLELAFEHVDSALEAYRKIYIHTAKPKSEHFERILIVLGKCASDSKIGQVEKYGEMLELVLADALRLNVYVTSVVWCRLLYFVACLPSQSNRRAIKVIWQERIAQNVPLDEGLLVKLLYFHAKVKDLPMAKIVFGRLVQLVGLDEVEKHHIVPLLQFGEELGQEQREFLQQWLERC